MKHCTWEDNEDYEDLYSFMSKSVFSNKFQLFWVLNISFCHIYHVLSAFYFLGISDFPQNGWLILQLYAELVVILDLILRFYIMYFCMESWESLWLLHDIFGLRSKLGAFQTLIGSLPLIFIVLWMTSNMDILKSFPVSLLRIPKLLRYREIWQISKTFLKSGKESFQGYIRLFRAALSVIINTHIIAWVWLIVGRIDPNRNNWIKMDSSIAQPSNIELYVDASFFVVTTMGGCSYGNILPGTHLEMTVDIFIMFVGASMYASLFANFVKVIEFTNSKSIEWNKLQEQAINFGYQLCIPDSILSRIRNYYNNMRIKYSDLHESIRNIKQLPTSLSSELWVTINSSLITEIKFFQFSDPMFILSIIRAMTPKLCMANDLVLEVGEIAEEMYFIKKGLTVVYATDNSTVIAYLSEGSYFGEIGILISKVRTVTVKAKTDWMFYVIQKDDLLRILELYPDQMAFLKAVGRQRMLTTDPEDLIEENDNGFQNLIDQNSILNEDEDNVSLIHNKNKKFSHNDSLMLKQNKYKRKPVNKKHPCNATKQYPVKGKFIIIPFSRLYYIWWVILLLALIYNLLIIPFTIAFEYKFDSFVYPIDIISILIFAVDIFFASKTAFDKNYDININLEETTKDYIESRLFLDILSILPLDYISMIFLSNQQFIAFWRILRLAKFIKLVDYFNIWRKYYLGKRNIWYIIFMIAVFVYLVHLNACIFYFIGKYEVGKHDRFDGQWLFTDLINRNFLSLSPVLEMSLLERYWHFMYLGAWTVGGTVYGDIVPFAMSEQLYNQVTTFLSRIIVAFIYAQASGYISSIYLTYSSHIESKDMTIEYLEIHNMPVELKKRVNKYFEILWDSFKGMNNDEIMSDLPESISKQMKLFVFYGFTEKLTIFPKEDKAAITSLITRLKISLVPEGEYIIREREIRDCIYFIIRGSVLIISNGINLTTLEQGAIFGEMSIAEKIPTVRNASAFWITPVWVGSLSIEDFKVICASYPNFEEKIQIEVDKRKADNLIKTPNLKSLEIKNKSNSTKRPSKFINNLEKSKSALSKISKDSSKKVSRQSLYEINEEENLKEIIWNQNPQKKSIQISLNNNISIHPPNFINRINKNTNKYHKIDDWKASLRIKQQENPNTPNSIKENSIGKILLIPMPYYKTSLMTKWWRILFLFKNFLC